MKGMKNIWLFNDSYQEVEIDWLTLLLNMIITEVEPRAVFAHPRIMGRVRDRLIAALSINWT